MDAQKPEKSGPKSARFRAFQKKAMQKSRALPYPV